MMKILATKDFLTAEHQRTVAPGLSLYLDAVRFLAALVVVLHHTWPLVFPRFPLPWPGHSAVVVFFVLSGFVIAHASRPHIGLLGYAHHRLARILPVALTALMLSTAISPLSNTYPVPNAGVMHFNWQSIGLNALFIAQSWMDVAPSFNPPYWSLNYEVWYYVIFGMWVYGCNRALIFFAILLAGPKILLLLPVWLLGVFLYKRMPVLSPRNAGRIFIATMASGLCFIWFDIAVHIRETMRLTWPVAMKYTGGSGLFVGDFLLGIIVAANFMSAGSIRFTHLFRFEVPIRYFASFTFSTYMFHMPLVIFIWNGLGLHSSIPFYGLLAILIFLLGQITERRTKFYRDVIGMFMRTTTTSP